MEAYNVLSIDSVKEYEYILADALQYSFPMLTESELHEAIQSSILSSYYNGPAYIENNYTKKKINGTVLDILNYIKKLEPIVTSSGVLFKKHKEADNPLAKMIMGFIKQRKIFKKEMFKYPKGTEMFEKYNLLQLLEKLNANATYGVLGAPTSMFYNIYVAEAITRQGRSYISTSIMFFESFLGGNVKFNSLNETIMFIHNVVGEKHKRTMDDSMILDRDITLEECFFKVMNNADILRWIPTEDEMARVWEYLRGLDNEDLNRIYYKNNLYTFCDNKVVSDLLVKILVELEWPFVNPNSPPDEIRDDLDLLTDILKEYVYYAYIPIDKLDRIEYMQRDIVGICDTDSTIISLDAWYRYLLDKVYDIDMHIKHIKGDMVEMVERDEFGDAKVPKNMVTYVEPRFDYDFYTDEVTEIERMKEPTALLPQDSLKYAIMNIMGYVCGHLIVDYLTEYTKLTGSYVEGVPCRMVMKNEFTFARALLTSHRRNYANLQVLQEGHVIPKNKQMVIAGLPIDKTTLSEDIKKKLKHILYEDIMTSQDIDQIKIMKDLVILEKDIYNSIMNGETKYYKPDNIAPMNKYKEPLSTNGIIAALVYNELRDETMPYINLEERNRIIKIKIDVTKKNIEKIKDTYPEVYGKLSNLLNHPTLGSKVKVIGLPVDTPVPKWVLEFVDYTGIINDQLKNFPLDSVGLNRLGNDSVNVSNIVQL